MKKNTRVLACQIDANLQKEMKDYVIKNGMTVKAYITGLLKADLEKNATKDNVKLEENIDVNKKEEKSNGEEKKTIDKAEQIDTENKEKDVTDIKINKVDKINQVNAENNEKNEDSSTNPKIKKTDKVEQMKADEKKKEEKKLSNKANSFEDMIAYVDKNGMITSTPPAENTPKEEIKLEEIVISTPKKDKEEPVIRRGRIEFFNESKGFGFIKDLSGVEKYFFHINNVLTDIAENNIVTFDLERGLKGMNAVNVALEVEKAKEKKENKETLNTES